jgi:hypothetical protein
MDTKRIALAALGSLAALAAQAFQGEQNPLPPPPFQSSLSRAQVQAEARTPLRISNGGTGVRAPISLADRAAVRAGARAVAANGAATYGEN